MKFENSENRKAARLSGRLKVAYTLLSTGDATPFEYGSSRTDDISESGLSFLVGSQVERGQLMHVNIQIPTGKQSLLLLGKVIWTEPQDDKKLFRVGVKFVGTLPKGFRQILAEHMPPKSNTSNS